MEDASNKKKNKLNGDRNAYTISVLDRKPKTKSPAFQSLENKVQNLTKVKQPQHTTTPGLGSENKKSKNFTGAEYLCLEATRNGSTICKQKQVISQNTNV